MTEVIENHASEGLEAETEAHDKCGDVRGPVYIFPYKDN